jgi:hypothetical protein
MLEKKFPDTYKLELPENLKVHPIFHAGRPWCLKARSRAQLKAPSRLGS